MQGACAGGLAVFAWAVVRLLRPQLQQHRGRGIALALATLAMTLLLPIGEFVVLLVAGGTRCRVSPGGTVNAVVLYLLLLRATALSFSGFASVPLIREDLVVQRAVLSDQELNSAIAISQASPGPLGLYVVVVGYFVAGVPGALAAALALATPAILAIPIARAVRRHRDSHRGRGHRDRVMCAYGDHKRHACRGCRANIQWPAWSSSDSWRWHRAGCHRSSLSWGQLASALFLRAERCPTSPLTIERSAAGRGSEELLWTDGLLARTPPVATSSSAAY